MALVRLMYASRATDMLGHDGINAILRTARQFNASAGITGVLCYCPTQSVFLQALEGGRSAVSSLYNRIVGDPRHEEIELLAFDEIGERKFGGWTMGQVSMQRLNPSLLLKYSETAELDPFTVAGAASAALLEELMATASVMGQA